MCSAQRDLQLKDGGGRGSVDSFNPGSSECYSLHYRSRCFSRHKRWHLVLHWHHGNHRAHVPCATWLWFHWLSSLHSGRTCFITENVALPFAFEQDSMTWRKFLILDRERSFSVIDQDFKRLIYSKPLCPGSGSNQVGKIFGSNETITSR